MNYTKSKIDEEVIMMVQKFYTYQNILLNKYKW